MLTDYQRKRVHAFFDSVLCLGEGLMDEVSEHHENMGDAQGEPTTSMPSAKSAESLQNLKSMSPMFRQITSEPESLEHKIHFCRNIYMSVRCELYLLLFTCVKLRSPLKIPITFRITSSGFKAPLLVFKYSWVHDSASSRGSQRTSLATEDLQ